MLLIVLLQRLERNLRWTLILIYVSILKSMNVLGVVWCGWELLFVGIVYSFFICKNIYWWGQQVCWAGSHISSCQKQLRHQFLWEPPSRQYRFQCPFRYLFSCGHNSKRWYSDWVLHWDNRVANLATSDGVMWNRTGSWKHHMHR